MIAKLKGLMGSIALKLALALLAMGGLIAASLLVSMITFQGIRDRFVVLEQDHVPDLRVGALVVSEANLLKDRLHDLLMARSRDEITALQAGVNAQLSRARAAIAGLRETQEAALAPLLETVADQLARMTAVRQADFDNRARIQSIVTDLNEHGSMASRGLILLADDTVFDLTLSGEETIETVDSTLTRLVDQDFRIVQLLLQIRGEVNLISAALLALGETRDSGLRGILLELAKASEARLDTALNQSAELGLDPAYFDPLGQVHAFYRKTLEGSSTFQFPARKEGLRFRHMADTALATAVDDLSFTLAIAADDASSSTEGRIRDLIDVQLGRIRGVADLDAAVKQLSITALEAAAAPDDASLNIAQERLATAESYLRRQLDGEVAAGLRDDLETLLHGVSGDAGIVAAQRAMIAGRREAHDITEATAQSVLTIAEKAREIGDGVVADIVAEGQVISDRIARAEIRMKTIGWAALAMAGLILMAAYLLIVRPLGRVTRATERLAAGNMDDLGALPAGAGEIGKMAAALAVFRRNILENQERQEAEIRRIEAEREAEKCIAEERARREAEQTAVVSVLGDGLEGLAGGNLRTRIDEPFPPAYEQLRQNFNSALGVLENAIGTISSSAGNIRGSTSEISAAAENLARRTEATASSLAQTASAIGLLTRSVSDTAEGTEKARKVARKVEDEAVANEETVRRTIAAMAEIQTSSVEIAKITDVLEDIAFQTNLLALNAGVEAARAGESGKGFAVVASEVRGLAQRATKAAKEISQLIARSGASVENGAAQVDKTGDALREIRTGISQVTEFVGEIAATSSDQSKSVSDINAAVVDLDKATQQNAAMFEQTTAASLSLRSETEELGRLISVFDFDAETGVIPIELPADLPELRRAVAGFAPGAVAPFEAGNWAPEAAPEGQGRDRQSLGPDDRQDRFGCDVRS